MTDEQTRTIDVDELRTLAIDRIRRRRNFQLHLVAHVILSVVLILIWATSEYQNAGGWPTGFRTGREDRDWDPWIIYPLIPLTVLLGVHAWFAFGRRPTTESDIVREIERLRSR
jgi:2TM domain